MREPVHGTDRANIGIHNFDNHSDRYVITHEELFLGHFGFVARMRRKVTTLTRESALGTSRNGSSRSPKRKPSPRRSAA